MVPELPINDAPLGKGNFSTNKKQTGKAIEGRRVSINKEISKEKRKIYEEGETQLAKLITEGDYSSKLNDPTSLDLKLKAKYKTVSKTLADLSQLQDLLPDLNLPEDLIHALRQLKSTLQESLKNENQEAVLDRYKQEYQAARAQIQAALASWEAQGGFALKIDPGLESALSKEYGFKFARLMEQAAYIGEAKLPGVEVPLPRGVSNTQLHQFLFSLEPEIQAEWEKLGEKFAKFRESKASNQGDAAFLNDLEVKKSLAAIQSKITVLFARAASDPTIYSHLHISKETEAWLQELKEKSCRLMVRSSGAEDSRTTANAGGNVSIAYVEPTHEALCHAMGEVVASYYGIASLKNRLNDLKENENLFVQSQHLAVCLQELIGEEVLSSKDIVASSQTPNSIPVSLVLFSNEPTYIGNEPFRVMRLSASYGHGEGVVGATGIRSDTIMLLRSLKHPERLYILEDIHAKPQRLAPVQDPETGKVSLQKVNNPQELVHNASLSPQLLTQLFYLGLSIEKVYDHPMDMELVVKEGKIYPVQARPVNRPEAHPTFLDSKKVEALQRDHPGLNAEYFKAESFLPGRAEALVIHSPKEVLIADKLEIAERVFKKGKHKLVLIRQEEPANSHPVVNFSGMGIPVMYSQEQDSLKRFLSKVSQENPLVACVQTGKLLRILNSKGADVDQCISSGYTVHPARIAVSVDRQLPISTSAESSLPEEIKHALMHIRFLESQETALQALKQLKGSLAASTEKKKEFLAEQIGKDPELPYAKELMASIEAWEKLTKSALSELKHTLQSQPEGRLHPLWHTKVVECLTAQPASPEAVGRMSFLNMDSQLKAVDKVARFRAQLNDPQKSLFSELVLDGKAALTPEHEAKWESFLFALEKASQQGLLSEKALLQSKAMLQQLGELDLMPLWMMRIFIPSANQFDLTSVENAVPLLTALLEQYPQNSAFLHKIKELRTQCSILQENSMQFGSPADFARSWQELKKLCANFIGLEELPQEGDLFAQVMASPSSSWQKELASATSIEKIAAYQLMEKVVTLYDSAIKGLKSSGHFEEQDKAQLFRKMLPGYYCLLGDWHKNLSGSLIQCHEEWPLDKYLAKMSATFADIKSTPDSLKPSASFNVAAARLGAQTTFDRSLPITLEDFFTLTHQNLITAIQALVQQEMQGKAALPKIVKDCSQAVELLFNPTQPRVQLTGYTCNEGGIKLHYNFPLRNHSATLTLNYDKISQKCSLDCELLGLARERWDNLANMLSVYQGLGLISVEKPAEIKPMSLTFALKMQDPQQALAALSFTELAGDIATNGYRTKYIEDKKLMQNLMLAQDNELLQKQIARHLAHWGGTFDLPSKVKKNPTLLTMIPFDQWPDEFKKQIYNDKNLFKRALAACQLNTLNWILKQALPDFIDKDMALNIVSINGLSLKVFPQWQNDPDIVLAAVKQHGFALSFAADNVKDNFDIVLAAVKQNGEALHFASARLQNHPKIAFAAFQQNILVASSVSGVKNNRKVFDYLLLNRPVSLCELCLFGNKDDVFAIVSHYGAALLFAKQYQNDPEIALAAVKQNGSALQHAHPDLKKDPNIVLAAVKQSELALQYAHPGLQNDPDIVLAAVKQSGLALQYAHPGLQNDPDIVLAAVKQSGLALQYAHPGLQNDPDIVLAAVKQNGLALKFAKELRDAVNIVQEAVKQNYKAIEYAGEIAKKDEGVCLAVCQKDKNGIRLLSKGSVKNKELLFAILQWPIWERNIFSYAHPELLKDINFVSELVEKCPKELQNAPQDFRENRDNIINLVKKNPEIIAFSRKYLQDREIALMALPNLPEDQTSTIRQIAQAMENDEAFLRQAIALHVKFFSYADKMQSDKEATLSAVKIRGANLWEAKKTADGIELRDDDEVVLTAVQQDGLALKAASERLCKKEEIALAAITQNGSAINLVHKDLMTKEFLLAAVKANPGCLEFISEEWRFDLEILQAAAEGNRDGWLVVTKDLYLQSLETITNVNSVFATNYNP